MGVGKKVEEGLFVGLEGGREAGREGRNTLSDHKRKK